MSDDLHSPTNAGPTPPGAAEAPAPPPVPGPSQAADAPGTPTELPPPGTADGALLGSPSATERPEVQAGLAFAGGLAAALILKRLTR